MDNKFREALRAIEIISNYVWCNGGLISDLQLFDNSNVNEVFKSYISSKYSDLSTPTLLKTERKEAINAVNIIISALLDTDGKTISSQIIDDVSSYKNNVDFYIYTEEDDFSKWTVVLCKLKRGICLLNLEFQYD